MMNTTRNQADEDFEQAVTALEEETDPPRECPYCGRICSVVEWLDKHACADCA
jgi:hypothetical protein